MLDSNQTRAASQRFPVRGRLISFVDAGRGLRWLVRDEHNAWLHLVASTTVVVAGLLLRVSVADWRWLVVAIAIVWSAEAFNTAIEELFDRITPEFDVAIGRIKDLRLAVS